MAIINCPECSAQISDKATTCPKCGCPVCIKNEPIMTPPPIYVQTPGNHSVYYPQLRAFVDAVQSAHTLAIVSLVLCLGIGIIFEIINLFFKLKKIKQMTLPPIDQLTPFEKAEYEAASKKLKSARTMTGVAWGISVSLIAITIMIAINGLLFG